MQRLWTPWRMAYILDDKSGACVFCERQDEVDDESAHIISRGAHVFAILNIYPYSVGHLMVCPFRHVGSWRELTADERIELFRLTRASTEALRRLYRPQAIHVGVNLGRAAGAGIQGHLHLHVVPCREEDRLDDAARPEIDRIPEPLAVTYGKLRGTLR